jgi:hypothetical protein
VDISLGGLSLASGKEGDEDAIRDVRRALELKFHQLLEGDCDPADAPAEAVRAVLGEVRSEAFLYTEMVFQDRGALFRMAAEAAVCGMVRSGCSITLELADDHIPIEPNRITIFAPGQYSSEEELLEQYMSALIELDKTLKLFQTE